MKMKNPELTQQEHMELLDILKNRFNKHQNRHPDVSFEIVESRLNEQPDKLWSLFEMEKTGGTPKDRRNVCYDREALEKRKQYKPENTAMDMAIAMGIELLSEEQYHFLQTLGNFDTKTSSWLKTPDDIRKLGGAIFGDKRYGQVFIYHNGADSYYGVRGFRGCLRV
jgi:hypothetical protein